MLFNKLFGQAELPEGKTVVYRTAVRAVIVRGGEILLVRSNQGYYKLPGGGVEEGEGFAEALAREVKEETGCGNCAVRDKIGVVIESRLDLFARDAYFQMVSHYYLCELADNEKGEQQLDAHEWERGFTAGWVDIGQAVRENQAVLAENEDQSFLHRENFVLNEVKRKIKF